MRVAIPSEKKYFVSQEIMRSWIFYCRNDDAGITGGSGLPASIFLQTKNQHFWTLMMQQLLACLIISSETSVFFWRNDGAIIVRTAASVPP